MEVFWATSAKTEKFLSNRTGIIFNLSWRQQVLTSSFAYKRNEKGPWVLLVLTRISAQVLDNEYQLKNRYPRLLLTFIAQCCCCRKALDKSQANISAVTHTVNSAASASGDTIQEFRGIDLALPQATLLFSVLNVEMRDRMEISGEASRRKCPCALQLIFFLVLGSLLQISFGVLLISARLAHSLWAKGLRCLLNWSICAPMHSFL